MTKPIIFLAALSVAGFGLDASAAGAQAATHTALAACLTMTLAALVLAYIGMRRSAALDEWARVLRGQLEAEREARQQSDQALAANHDVLCRLARQHQAGRPLNDGLRGFGPADGLRHALERKLAEHAQLHGLRYRFEAGVDPAAHRSSRAARLAVFGVLQEVLAMTGGRDGGAELHVRLSEGACALALDIQLGATLQVEQLRVNLAQPLSEQLADRVRALGGVLRVATAPDRPCHWSLSLPVGEPADAH